MYRSEGPDFREVFESWMLDPPGGKVFRPTPRRQSARDWKRLLRSIQSSRSAEESRVVSRAELQGELHYVLDLSDALETGAASLWTTTRLSLLFGRGKKGGDLGSPHPFRFRAEDLDAFSDPADRRILASLAGAQADDDYYRTRSSPSFSPSGVHLLSLIPDLVKTGRAWVNPTRGGEDLLPLRWDGGEPWELWLEAERDEALKRYHFCGSLRRGTERMTLAEPDVVFAGGLLFKKDGLASRYLESVAWSWVAHLREHRSFSVPFQHRDRFLEEVLRDARIPRLDLPEELRFEEREVAPRPTLKVRPPPEGGRHDGRLLGELEFDYEGTLIREGTAGGVIFHPSPPRRILRDLPAERDALSLLKGLGFRTAFDYKQRKVVMGILPRKLPAAVARLVGEGWKVEAEGKVYRRPGGFRIEVSSGIDWFDLAGGADFEGQWVPLPRLLAALKKGQGWVVLGDGTLGMLPEEWLKKYQVLGGLGSEEGDVLRFGKCQVGLLDAVLAAQPEVSCDEVFVRAREALRGFEGVRPAEAGAEFRGELRPYQREGLGWIHFLRGFGFGGCLADDMGLGKTVQVLALLEARRERRGERRDGAPRAPSLVIVPRSLVFNWKAEAARFAPRLRVLDHTGLARAVDPDLFARHDVVITTYGTLRRDALALKEFRFDYVVLDEAQAAKNAASETAKAARLLQADHRLAMSGTPVENHLGELWSLFEFLNPGMLGASAALCGRAGARAPDGEARGLLARALRPFILRRTKEQVAKDLPPKVEQTLHCELEAGQRELYDELRAHYRRSLLKTVDLQGLDRSKIQVLEALLRLRQAALHPGLVDANRRGEPSAKLDVLLPRLQEVLEEGHKALVFSQFTRMLKILRDRLEAEGISCEYLDGRTRDREAKVKRFQEDPQAGLFLISLKAGGLGLNLTSAGYVFLLDPWWNPAVEAQAIDRAHRIGQDKQVFAYRLIARGTVEEKVLELQERKRALAASIIGEENSLIRDLRREDLEMLLS